MNIAAETGKAVRNFFDVMKESPLSLALVVSNFLLLGFLFYNGVSSLNQRRETVDLIVGWQRETDKLMASCVSADIMKLVLDALEAVRKQSPTPNPLKLPLELPSPNWALPSPASIPLPRPRPNGE